MEICVLLLAAGSGRRMGGDVPKQYLPVAGEPMIRHTLRHLGGDVRIRWVLPVLAPGDSYFAEAVQGERFPFKLLSPVTGGKERADSMAAGLASSPIEAQWIAVHDAARVLPGAEMLKKLFDMAALHGAAVPGLPVSDTIKQVNAEGRVLSTPKRESLRAVQTPQVVRRDWLQSAIDKAGNEIASHTDDASVIEAAGYPVYVSTGDRRNRKITTPEDIDWLEQELSLIQGKQPEAV